MRMQDGGELWKEGGVGKRGNEWGIRWRWRSEAVEV